MKIGYFNRIPSEEKGGPDRFGGELDLSGVIRGNFRLIQVDKRQETSPTHALQLWQNGAWAMAGSAWYQHSREDENKPQDKRGPKHFSCKIQMPMLDRQTHSFRVFEGDSDEQPEGWKKGDPVVTFNAVWSAPTARAQAPVGGGQIQDSIPY